MHSRFGCLEVFFVIVEILIAVFVSLACFNFSECESEGRENKLAVDHDSSSIVLGFIGFVQTIHQFSFILRLNENKKMNTHRSCMLDFRRFIRCCYYD